MLEGADNGNTRSLGSDPESVARTESEAKEQMDMLDSMVVSVKEMFSSDSTKINTVNDGIALRLQEGELEKSQAKDDIEVNIKGAPVGKFGDEGAVPTEAGADRVRERPEVPAQGGQREADEGEGDPPPLSSDGDEATIELKAIVKKLEKELDEVRQDLEEVKVESSEAGDDATSSPSDFETTDEVLSSGSESDPHRFLPTPGASTGTVDIATGGWDVNGKMVTASATGIGGTSAAYIVATLTMATTSPLQPASMAIAAQAAAPDAADYRTKRLICQLFFDGAEFDYANRFQVGDIIAPSGAMETSSGVWTTGDAGGADYIDVSTDRQYDGSSHKYQVKLTRISMIDGSIHIGEESSTWTDVITFADCP